MMKRRAWIPLALAAAGAIAVYQIGLPPSSVTFSEPAGEVDAYDIVEVSAEVAAPRAPNPFTDAAILGTFKDAATGRVWQVDGFSDSQDGGVYRVRFSPPSPGDYSYTAEYRQGWSRRTASGKFHVRDGHRRGPLRIDPEHRWHFIWEGTGEHYFFHGTTAYWLMGWKDDRVIQSSLDRLHRLKVNRIRVTLAGRSRLNFGEPVVPGPIWTSFVEPWQTSESINLLRKAGYAGQRFGMGLGNGLFDALANLGASDDIYHPGFNYARFNVHYWQKFERAIRYARDRDIIVSVVLDMDDGRAHPLAGSADEERFIRYAVARFGAFSNITWDLGDDLDAYRDDRWTHETGTKLKQWDPYRHLATSHPVNNSHQDRSSGWFDFTSFQEWSRSQHAFMLSQRKLQEQSGRIIPLTNEEYGYEDHYPKWVEGPGADSADTLRRMAWEIVMAGGYQTTGESARRGTNIWPDTGGGWVNGRGDATMTMLEGYAHMVDFFTSFDWWRTEPHDELVDGANYCLALPGMIYAIYLPHGGQTTVRLEPGRYRGVLKNAVTGESTAIPAINALTPIWTSPTTPGPSDWAIILRRE
jgi:hypothetical protein